MTDRSIKAKFIGGPAKGISEIWEAHAGAVVRFGDQYRHHVYHRQEGGEDGLPVFVYQGDNTSNIGLSENYYELPKAIQ